MGDAGLVVIASFIRGSVCSATRCDCASPGDLQEVFVNAPLQVCERRDPKGLYVRTRRGEIAQFTGVSAPFEVAVSPEVIIVHQSVTVLKAIEEFRFDALIGGALRDEEKARAKERVFSHRDAFGQWQPKGQRPELCSLFNTRRQSGEHFRVFLLSNWTELDVWQYIEREQVSLPRSTTHPRGGGAP